MDYQSIFVTGGAGFVGSSLSIALKTRYPEVRIVVADNLKRRGSELNIPRLRSQDIAFVHADIRNPEDLYAAGDDIDLILECSAEPSVLAGYGGRPDYVVNTNLLGTINCLELARRTNADLVFLSTSRVYPIEALNSIELREDANRMTAVPEQALPGVSERGISEAFPLEGPRSLYGATKLCSEILIQEYGSMYGLRFIINRCSVVAGPWQMGKADQGVFTLWVARHYFRRDLRYIGWGGEGKQVRDLLHIDDLAELVDLQLQRLPELAGDTFNVGGGSANSLSLLETTRLCEEITGHRMAIGSDVTTRPGDVKWYVTDNAKVMGATGWAPRQTPRNTLESICEWIRGSEAVLKTLL